IRARDHRRDDADHECHGGAVRLHGAPLRADRPASGDGVRPAQPGLRALSRLPDRLRRRAVHRPATLGARVPPLPPPPDTPPAPPYSPRPPGVVRGVGEPMRPTVDTSRGPRRPPSVKLVLLGVVALGLLGVLVFAAVREATTTVRPTGARPALAPPRPAFTA